ncbi:lymphocyte antigen 96 [Carettochelys insculpta]|uniref:lymphocyte antigen 96 n=1 Tax=Carettochelys insculpta TaxID=44489 RepID=UPI003EBA9EC2
MFLLVSFILFTCGFIESERKILICESSETEIFYSFCDSVDHKIMFNIVPCTFTQRSWEGSLFWIPRSDIIFLKGVLHLWYAGAKILEWKQVICSGFDDDYSFCGTLKGESINTTFGISGMQTKFPQGLYTVVIRGFSDHFEKNLLLCANISLLMKTDG